MTLEELLIKLEEADNITDYVLYKKLVELKKQEINKRRDSDE